jgi:hypothetical protein
MEQCRSLEEATQFMDERLALSGIDALACPLGLEPFGIGGAVVHGIYDSRLGFAIPYFDIDGKQTDLLRVRFKHPHPDLGKYSQPSLTRTYIYFPPNLEGGWRTVSSDLSQKITITEGELKAACACARDIPTIAIGGVGSWRRTGTNQLHPKLLEVGWEGRDVDIVFDNDVMRKKEVQAELHALSAALHTLLANVRSVYLPQHFEEKVGLDDYLVKVGSVEQFNELEREVVTAEQASNFDLAASYAVAVESKRHVVYPIHGRLDAAMNKATFVDSTGGRCLKVKNPSTGKVRMVSPAEIYLQWPGHTKIDDVYYLPGQDRLVTHSDGKRVLNAWTGWGVTPWDGDPAEVEPVAKMWNDHIDYLLDGDEHKSRYLKQWLAWPIQHPSEKMKVAVYLHSAEQGVGKSLLFDVLSAVYGEANHSVPDQGAVGGRFNSWSVTHLAIIDELGTGDKRLNNDKLKGLISKPNVHWDEKNCKARKVPATANYVILTNYADSIKMDRGDRRWFVHRILAEAKTDPNYYARLAELAEGDNPSKLMAHLLMVDLEGFNPHERPEECADHAEAVETSSEGFVNWVYELAANFEEWAKRRGFHGDLLSRNQLMALYNGEQTKTMNELSETGVSREIGKCAAVVSRACQRYARERRYKSPPMCFEEVTGDRVALYAFRNQDKWSRASTSEASEHFNETNLDKKELD